MPLDIAPALQGAQDKQGSPILEICSVERINVSLNGLYACTESNGKHSRDILRELAANERLACGPYSRLIYTLGKNHPGKRHRAAPLSLHPAL
jgi:hypothetical protein